MYLVSRLLQLMKLDTSNNNKGNNKNSNCSPKLMALCVWVAAN